MKQCILITGVLLAYISSFANEMTSYALHEYSPTQTQTDTKKYRIYVRDHLGSTRAVIDETGELLQTVNYYASGVPFTLTQGETATDRLHSGKQFIDHQGLGYYDNSARMLDVLGSRFTTLDPMATDYGHLSPYSNCAGNPLKYTDPDGRVVIFINGFHCGDGGSPDYWEGLDNHIMYIFGDNKALYYDGSMGGYAGVVSPNSNISPANRFSSGRNLGLNNAKDIIDNLADDESIKFVTHSMGAAFAKGFINGLQSYATENNIDITEKIMVELDLAPFQPTDQEACPNVKTIVIQHAYDAIAGISKMPGASKRVETRQKIYITDKNAINVYLHEHSVNSFTEEEISDIIKNYFEIRN